ncbi:MAG: hypothetical protein PVH19_12425, partial [Planctomycetia bacterium]
MLRILGILSIFLAATSSLHAEENVEQLIDQLTKVSKPGIGYSRYWYGTEFLPYDDATTIVFRVLWVEPPSRSETLRKIVSQGAKAVPVLLKHLDDDRKTAIEPIGKFNWIDLYEEYDHNSRIENKSLRNVDLRHTVCEENPYRLKVGDLCFVALGQIVNRDFWAVRFQPPGGVSVSSPVHSKALQEVIGKDWADFTVDKHRHLLIEDFKKADHTKRRIGAYQRLSFYFPNVDVVESLVLNELQRPAFKSSEVENFCYNVLYKTKNPKQRKKLFDQFIRKHGEQYAQGIRIILLNDLRFFEIGDRGRLYIPSHEIREHPRRLLIQLFNEPEDVKSTEVMFVHVRTEYERSDFVHSLTHDKSEKISDRVKELFLETPDNEVLAPAYLFCLAKRGGNGDFLVEQLAKIDLFAEKTNPL